MNLTAEIVSLKELMEEVLVRLDNINTDNFDDYFHLVVEKAERAQNIKNELKIKYPPDLLKKNEKELLFLAKQIKISYDNLVRKNRDESSALSDELQILMNSRKIANYNR